MRWMEPLVIDRERKMPRIEKRQLDPLATMPVQSAVLVMLGVPVGNALHAWHRMARKPPARVVPPRESFEADLSGLHGGLERQAGIDPIRSAVLFVDRRDSSRGGKLFDARIRTAETNMRQRSGAGQGTHRPTVLASCPEESGTTEGPKDETGPFYPDLTEIIDEAPAKTADRAAAAAGRKRPGPTGPVGQGWRAQG